MRKIIIFLAILHVMFLPVLHANACNEGCGGNDNNNNNGSILGGGGSAHLNAGGITAISVGGLGLIGAGSYFLAEKMKNVPHLYTWSEIINTSVKSPLSNSEFQDYLSKSHSNYNLLSKALEPDNIKLVSNIKNKSDNQRVYVIADSEIKGNSIHYFTINLPEDLKRKNNLTAEATLVYKTTNPADKVNFHISSNKRYDSMTKNINNTQSNEKIISQNKELNVNTVQKKFRIGQPKKPMIMAISLTNSQKPNMPASNGKYAVLVKILD